MKVIRKAYNIDTDCGDRIVRVTRIKELCGGCKKSLAKYWKYCPYCGEFITRGV